MKIHEFLADHPYLRLYGEWLVPHTLKTYQSDAWKKFYIFDVYYDSEHRFMGYEDYRELLEEYDLEYIPCISPQVSFQTFVMVRRQHRNRCVWKVFP